MTPDPRAAEPLPPLPKSPSGRTPQWVIDEARERQRRAEIGPVRILVEERRGRKRMRRADRILYRGLSRDPRRRSWSSVVLVLAFVAGLPAAVGLLVVPLVEQQLVSASAPAPDGQAPPVPQPSPGPQIPPVPRSPENDDVATTADVYTTRPELSGPVPERRDHPDMPPPGVGSAAHPLGTPPPVPDVGDYRFLQLQESGSRPVAYDPCRPIHYVVRPDGVPPGGQQLVEAAVAEIAAATGLRFVSDGTTTEAPRDDRRPYQPGRYGERWAPVLITWSHPAEQPQLAGEVAGLGGSVSLRVGDNPSVYVTGQIALDAPDLHLTLQQPGGDAVVRAVLLHELGHVLGLGHVDDPAQLMHASSTVHNSALSPGDRAGLARLGAGQCVPQL